MSTFLRPTSFKLKIFLGLIVYVLASILLLASFNSARNIHPPEINPVEQAVSLVALPAYILSLPALIVTTFFKPPQPAAMLFNPYPLKGPSAGSVAVGILVELALLYLLACICSQLRTAITRRR